MPLYRAVCTNCFSFLQVLLILTPSYAFFLGKKSTKRPPPPSTVHYEATNVQLNEIDGYGSPAAPVITTYEPSGDSYGSPAAPVVSYQEPQSYSGPVKVKKSVPPPILDIDDGYGSPLAPVVSASAQSPSR